MKVGLIIIATGAYDQFVEPLLDSVDRWFLNGHDVRYYLFTDNEKLLSTDRVGLTVTYKKHEPWPNPTLLRYKCITEHSDLFDDRDYLYYCDADMLFENNVGDEILSDRVVTIHPGYLGKRGTPESNPKSTAYININDPIVYYAGGFNGGTKKEFLLMAKQLSKNIDDDLENDIIAVWHDESHLNRYFMDNNPTKVLSPAYCHFGNIPMERKLIALDKNHDEIRS
tara:strand:+ start:1531 stop:2205 length:675 start_codon:yes stop_codon:yes gene_type:complete